MDSRKRFPACDHDSSSVLRPDLRRLLARNIPAHSIEGEVVWDPGIAARGALAGDQCSKWSMTVECVPRGLMRT